MRPHFATLVSCRHDTNDLTHTSNVIPRPISSVRRNGHPFWRFSDAFQHIRRRQLSRHQLERRPRVPNRLKKSSPVRSADSGQKPDRSTADRHHHDASSPDCISTRVRAAIDSYNRRSRCLSNIICRAGRGRKSTVYEYQHEAGTEKQGTAYNGAFLAMSDRNVPRSSPRARRWVGWTLIDRFIAD